MHGIKPKTYIKTKYQDIVHTWDTYGVIEVAVVDNGREFHSEDFEDANLQLGTVVQYAPLKLAWYKGSIERSFRTLNTSLLHLQPGTTFSNIFDLADYDPSENAIIDFETLDHILHRWIADIYHQKKHTGIQDTPSHKWKNGTQEHPPYLPSSKHDLQVLLGQVDERTITPSGITLHGLPYNDDSLGTIRQGARGKKVKIKSNPMDLTMIHAYDNFKGIYIPVSVDAQYFDYVNGMNLWQHEIIRRHARLELNGRLDRIGLARAKEDIQAIVADAWNQNRKKATRVRIARFKGIGQKNHQIKKGKDEGSVEQETPVSCDPQRNIISLAEHGRSHRGLSGLPSLGTSVDEPAEGGIMTSQALEEKILKKKANVIDGDKKTKKRRNYILGDSEVGKKKCSEPILAEGDDLDINMSGWAASYGLPK